MQCLSIHYVTHARVVFGAKSVRLSLATQRPFDSLGNETDVTLFPNPMINMTNDPQWQIAILREIAKTAAAEADRLEEMMPEVSDDETD